MNLLQIMGRLGIDPEERFTSGGQKVITLRVATSSKQGGKEETLWWRVTIWGDRFDRMMPYLKKGSSVIAIGEMKKPTIYTDKSGQPQASLEMTAEMLKFAPSGGNKGDNKANSSNEQEYTSGSSSEEAISNMEMSSTSSDNNAYDDIPF